MGASTTFSLESEDRRQDDKVGKFVEMASLDMELMK